MAEAPHFTVAPLTAHHDRADFQSGVEPLDRHLRVLAGQDVRRRLAAVFVFVDAATGAIAAYYTLSALSVDPGSLPLEVARRLPQRPVPCTLLGRLAVDTRYRGQGLGAAALAHALGRAQRAGEDVAAMAVVVDAKDEAARSFYEHHGFERFLDDEFRLFLPLQSAAKLFPGHATG